MSTENHLQSLERQHAELKEQLRSEQTHPKWDEAAVQRLKHEKLQLKDRIEELRRDERRTA